MTNMEYYRGQIEAITNNGDNIALDRHCGELRPCGSTQCNNCIFYEGRHCRVDILRWLMAEHKEEPTLTQRDYHLAQLLPDGWVARDSDSILYWYDTKPKKVSDFWDNGIGDCEELTWLGYVLEFIHWDDAEPWSVEDLRKLKVRENND